MCYTIKQLGEDKFGEMAAMYRNVFSSPPWNDDWSDTGQLMAYIKDIAGCWNSLNYGLYDGDKMIALAFGCSRHWWSGTEYVIEEFCVSPKMQGKGIGSRFLTLIEGEVRKLGLNGIYLCTERDKPAYDFYVKNGFAPMPNHISFYKSLEAQTGAGDVEEFQFVQSRIFDCDEICGIIDSAKKRSFCPWDENYPGREEILRDIHNCDGYCMKDGNGKIVSYIARDSEPEEENLPFWNSELNPETGIARIVVAGGYENRSLARKTITAMIGIHIYQKLRLKSLLSN